MAKALKKVKMFLFSTPVSRAVQGHTPPPGKFMKSRRLRIHFKHSGAKIRAFEQNTDILNFGFFFLSDSR